MAAVTNMSPSPLLMYRRLGGAPHVASIQVRRRAHDLGESWGVLLGFFDIVLFCLLDFSDDFQKTAWGRGGGVEDGGCG